jgi:hypothetical protein
MNHDLFVRTGFQPRELIEITVTIFVGGSIALGKALEVVDRA